MPEFFYLAFPKSIVATFEGDFRLGLDVEGSLPDVLFHPLQQMVGNELSGGRMIGDDSDQIIFQFF